MRPDLEKNNRQLVTLEARLPGKKTSLYMVAYRPWQPPGQQDRTSGTMAAQAECWGRLLTRWEAALRESKEVIMVMDANLDTMTWSPTHSLATASASTTPPSSTDCSSRSCPRGSRW